MSAIEKGAHDYICNAGGKKRLEYFVYVDTLKALSD